MNIFYKHRVFLGAAALTMTVILTLILCFFALSRTAAYAQRFTVVLDAGHGGIDGGVVGVNSGKKESEFNLEITFLLQQKFEDAGFNVVLTRKTEAGLYGAATPGYKKRDMQKRAKIINESNPALMISIHQNYFTQSGRRGAQVFYRANSAESIALAGNIQSKLNGMEECVKKSQSLAGDYFILNCNHYPSVIVECGFLSNAEDEKLLLSDDYREKLVEAIFSGAISFLSSSVAKKM